jgi:DNA adenine methylase
MKYLGGKNNLGNEISSIIKDYWDDTLDGYFEPFCGSLGVLKRMIDLPTTIYANDYHADLIQMWKEVQEQKLKYPQSITEEEYENAKLLQSPNALKAFIGFGMSFGGRFFGGFCKKYVGNKKEDFCAEMRNTLKKMSPQIKEVVFTNEDYRTLKPINMLIYCDPPYKSHKHPIKYRRDTKHYDTFDNDEFWEIMRIWSENNIVIISETNAPNDFYCIWEKDICRSASKSKNTLLTNNTEKLFTLNLECFMGND